MAAKADVTDSKLDMLMSQMAAITEQHAKVQQIDDKLDKLSSHVERTLGSLEGFAKTLRTDVQQELQAMEKRLDAKYQCTWEQGTR